MRNLLLIFFIGILIPSPVDCPIQGHLPTVPGALISQPFGYKQHVGIDYDVHVGTPVYADVEGVVIATMDNARVYGRFIEIEHPDGYASIYAHLSKSYVSLGERVYAGQMIALSGGDPYDRIDGDGWSSGAHLHWEVRVPGHLDNNLYNVDPLLYIQAYLVSFSPSCAN